MKGIQRTASTVALAGALVVGNLGIGSAAANAAPPDPGGSWAQEQPWYPLPNPGEPWRGGNYWGPPPPPVKHDNWGKGWGGPPPPPYVKKDRWDTGWKPNCVKDPYGYGKLCK